MSSKSKIYKDILAEYDRLQSAAAAAQKDRQKEVYGRVPRLRAIEEEISQTGLRTVKIVLSSPARAEELTEKLRQRVEELKKEKETLLLQNGYPTDYLDIQYACPFCQDTGYIEGEKCACFQQKFVNRAYQLSNLKEVLERENFDFFDFRFYSPVRDESRGMSPLENMKKILNVCVRFTANFDQEFTNLLLYGGTGLGKTFLCNCIAKDLLDRGRTVLYVTAGSLFKIVEDARFGRGEDEEPQDYMEDILSVDLFIIDDLGTEFSTVLTASELFHMVNSRLLERKPCIISTNMEPKDLAAQYSDRIVSRLAGNYEFLEFFGEDIRMKKAAEG